MSKRLEGKVALITGAACGIGRAHAELFAREGATVVVTTRRKEAEGEKLVHAIQKNGDSAVFMKLDVRSEEEWRSVIDKVIALYGKLNILVNNAGISLAKTVENTDLNDWNDVMTTNSTGVFLGTKYAILAMKANNEPCSIINISSIDAIIGEAPLAAYCASKGAVRAFTRSAALACAEAKYPIRVNGVYPGYIRTELTEKEANDSGLTPEQYFQKVGQLHPIGHIGTGIDVAQLGLYLASDESKWVTGAEMVVDGGYTAR